MITGCAFCGGTLEEGEPGQRVRCSVCRATNVAAHQEEAEPVLKQQRRCFHCDAPLPFIAGGGRVRCRTCHTLNHAMGAGYLQRSEQPGLLAALERATGSGSEGRRRSGTLVMVLTAACILGLLKHGDEQLRQSRAVWEGKACLVEHNGDQIADIAGLVRVGTGDRRAPIVIDGSSGEVLWRGHSSEELERIFCPAPELIALVTTLPGLKVYLAANPALGWEVNLRNSPEQYAVGRDCLSLADEAGNQVGLLLEDGTPTPCPARPTTPTTAPSRLGRGGLLLETQRGVDGGQLRVMEEGRLLWSTHLPEDTEQIGQTGAHVLVGQPGGFSALDRRSGAPAWTFRED